ncbi:MAG TPA: hypothetical protein VM265_07220 [Sphingomicrobium sp.]|nr:hypothetical protein [Sphingomicrobium sp.]
MSEQDQAGQRSSGIRESARQRAIGAYDGARESVASAGRRVGTNIDEAPLIALAGGIAAGALLAALLPRTEAETRALRPIGDRIKGSAGAAATAAREAGTARLAELGLTRDKGSEALRSIFQGAADAARTSAQAALGTARKDD